MTGVFWHALVFGLAPILQKLAGLILLPLYTHYLSPRDYGEIEILTVVTGLFTVILKLELRQGIMRAWHAGGEAERGALFRGALRLLGGLGLVGFVLFLALSGPLCDWLVGARISWSYRLILAIGVFADVASLPFQATLQARLRSGAMVTLGVLQFIVAAGLTVVSVVGFRSGPIGFFIGGTAAQLFGLVSMAVLERRLLGAPMTQNSGLVSLLRFSLPLLVGALLYFVVRNADRVLVSRLLSVADLGVYAMAWTLANLLMTMLFLPLQSSLDVWRYRLHAEPDGAAQFASVFRISMLGIGLAAIGLDTFGADAFVGAADPRFAGAVALLPALSVAVLLQVGYSIVASAFFVSGATGRWSVLFAIGAAAQVSISLVAIPLLGLAGAASGSVGANLILYVSAAIGGTRFWRVPYDHRLTAALVVLVPVCAALRIALAPTHLPGVIAADSAACLVFVAALWALGLWGPADPAAALRMLGDRLAVRQRLRAAREGGAGSGLLERTLRPRQ